MSKEDHIFTFSGGKLISMVDTKIGNALVFNINGRNQSLNPSSIGNGTYFRQVSEYYAREQGFKGDVNYNIEPEGGKRGGFYSSASKSITMTDITYLNSQNIYDIKSTVGHEVGHSKSKDPVSSFLEHAGVYLRQDLEGTSDDYKVNNANQFVNRVLNAFDSSKIDSDGMSKAIENYNDKNNGGVKIRGLNYMGTLNGANFKTSIDGMDKRNGFQYKKLENPSQ